MTMLIVEQGETIESQRNLIRELFRDSSELSATKMKAQRDKTAATQHSQAPAAKTQSPSSQNQTQAPSSQAVPQHPAQNPTQNQTKTKPQYTLPSRPASDLMDTRRALITI